MSLEADYVIGEVELDAETVPWRLGLLVYLVYLWFSSRSLFCPIILYIIVVLLFLLQGLPGMSQHRVRSNLTLLVRSHCCPPGRRSKFCNMP